MRQKRLGRCRNDSTGSVAVILAVGLMVVLVGFISLAVDLGHLYTVRNELQNTCDAATLAGVRALIVEDTIIGGGTTAPGVHLDPAAANDAVMAIINNAGAQQGMPAVSSGDAALTITFGHWNDKTSTWTAIGDYSSVPRNPSSTDPNFPNAVQVRILRGNTGTYGPVTNFFGGIFGLCSSGLEGEPGEHLGIPTSQVAATSRAYLGNAMSVPTGTIPIPLTLPANILDPNAADQSVRNSLPGWFNWLVGPDPAVADTGTIKRFVFQDTGGNYVPPSVGTSPPSPLQSDLIHGYWFCVNQSDPVPQTLTNILTEAALTTHTHYNNGSSIYFVQALSYGARIYPRTEFGYLSYNVTNFRLLQNAWNAKKDANGHWRMTLPVYSATQYPLGALSRLEKGFRYLSRLLGPADAYACISYNGTPKVYVNGFATVEITEVGYKNLDSSSPPTHGGCDQCGNWSSQTNPQTGQPFGSKKECLQYATNGCWRTNYAIIENVRDVSTIIPGAGAAAPAGDNKVYASTGLGGGPSNSQIPGSNAPVGVGGLAPIPRLIPVN